MTYNPLPLVAEIELVYKTNVRAADRQQIKGSESAYQIFRGTWDEDKIELLEQAKLMLLNRSNRLLGLIDLSTGGVSGTVIDPKLVFAAALKANASSILLAHNHPSGNIEPSEQDLRITRQIRDAGKLLTLPLHDHLIICIDGYYSMSDAGQLSF